MEKTSYFRTFCKYTSLNVLGMLALSCYILADTFFVSQRMGANGLAALNLAVPVYNFLNGTGLMLGMGAATHYSIAKSQGNDREADRYFTHAVALVCGFTALYVVLGLFFPGPIVRLFGASGEVYGMSETYLQTLLLFSPAFLLNNTLLCFVRNDGAPQLSMAGMITGSLSNVVLDWVFMYPLGLGIFGAAFATGLAPVISIAVMAPHWLSRKKGFHLRKERLRPGHFAGILKSGVPSLVTEASSGIVMIAFNALFLQLSGNTGVAAYGVVANLALVAVSIFTGISQGVQPLFSRAWGAQDHRALQKNLRYAVVCALVFSAALYVVVFLFARPLTAVFNSGADPTLQALAEPGMRLYFLACPFVGINVLLSVYFTSTEHPGPAQLLSLLYGFLVLLPMVFLLSAVGGVTGTWCAYPATHALVCVVGLLLFRRLHKKTFAKALSQAGQ